MDSAFSWAIGGLIGAWLGVGFVAAVCAMLWAVLEICGKILKCLGHWGIFLDFVVHRKAFAAWLASRPKKGGEAP